MQPNRIGRRAVAAALLVFACAAQGQGWKDLLTSDKLKALQDALAGRVPAVASSPAPSRVASTPVPSAAPAPSTAQVPPTATPPKPLLEHPFFDPALPTVSVDELRELLAQNAAAKTRIAADRDQAVARCKETKTGYAAIQCQQAEVQKYGQQVGELPMEVGTTQVVEAIDRCMEAGGGECDTYNSDAFGSRCRASSDACVLANIASPRGRHADRIVALAVAFDYYHVDQNAWTRAHPAAPGATFQPPVDNASTDLAQYPLGSFDLDGIRLVGRRIDKSQGFSTMLSYFFYLEPKFSSDDTRALWLELTAQPRDPLYYASKSYKLPVANIVAAKPRIDALAPQARVEMLSALLMQSRMLRNDGLRDFLVAFPELRSIEFRWSAPRVAIADAPALALTRLIGDSQGNRLRGGVFDMLASNVMDGSSQTDERGRPLVAVICLKVDPLILQSFRKELAAR